MNHDRYEWHKISYFFGRRIMKWQGRRGSTNVRTSSGGGKLMGGGIGGIIIAGILVCVKNVLFCEKMI